MKKRIILIFFICSALVILSFLFTWFFMNSKVNSLEVKYSDKISLLERELDSSKKEIEEKNKKLEETDKSGDQESSNNQELFIPKDKILYFYSDACGYCQQQKPIVEELAKQGINFQLMNTQENPNYFNDYSIKGTPAFIFKDIDNRLIGFQSKENLIEFWQNNK